ncbi:MAG: tetratricopeptide repeat protein [Spirulina sp. SIO3F2]|nr:tetratricopeptide repeat protein [Spirulina sp. SIO3F2]
MMRPSAGASDMAQLLNQRYQFLQSLGVNGSGQTVLVGDTQKDGHPPCVLKQLRLPSSNPTTLEFSLRLLKNEAERLKRIGHHPQIPQILDYFYEGQSFYLVEEYVAGRSVAMDWATGQLFGEVQVVRLLREILPILEFSHQNGVIHRCLKPDSILRRQSDRKIMLVGFGAFREIRNQILRQQGQTGPVLNTNSTAYIAPEQAIGKAQPNSDLYALGVMVIQSLTGQSAQDVVQITTDEDSTTWESKLTISASLVAVLKKMVHPNAQQRYAAAADALDALETIALLTTTNGSTRSANSNGHRLHQTQPPVNGHRPSRSSTASISASPKLPAQPPPPPPRSPAPQPTPTSFPHEGAAVPPVWHQHLAQSLQSSIAQALRRRSSEPADTVTDTEPPEVSAPETTTQPHRVASGSGRWMGGLAIVMLLAIAGLVTTARIPQRLLSAYWRNQGQTASQQEDWSAALTAYNRALDWQPDRGTTHYERGQVHQALGDRQAALEDFSIAIERRSRLDQAYYQRANVRFNLGDYEGALSDFGQALQANPDSVKAYVNRGNTYAALGQEPQALEDFNQAIALDETLAPAYVSRCLSRSNLDDHEGALTDCNRAINLRPTHTFAYQNRGLVRRRLGDAQGAIADYNIAIELDNQDPEPFYNRGLARTELGDLAGAIDDFSAALELDPDHLLAYYDRGLTHAEQGNLPAAKTDLQEAAQRCLESSRLLCYQDAQQALQDLDGIASTPETES